MGSYINICLNEYVYIYFIFNYIINKTITPKQKNER